MVSDLVLAVSAMAMFGGSPDLEVSVLGKVRTALLLAGAPVLLLAQIPGLDRDLLTTIAYVLLVPGCIGHVGAAVDYLVQCVHKHRRLRAAGLNPRDRKSWSHA